MTEEKKEKIKVEEKKRNPLAVCISKVVITKKASQAIVNWLGNHLESSGVEVVAKQ